MNDLLQAACMDAVPVRAIGTGLYRRERTGEGFHVTTSLLAQGVWASGVVVPRRRRAT